MLRRDNTIERIAADSSTETEVTDPAREAGERNSAIAAQASEARRELGAGASLDASVRSSMESSFGSNFSDVRVHQGGTGDARAVARGTDLHFAPGEYDPHSQRGRELIGHELAHVVQQRHGQVSGAQQKRRGGAGDSALEREADAAGDKAARGLPAGMAPSAGAVSAVASQAKLGATRGSLRGTARGASQVTFELILDQLDQYHANPASSSPDKAPVAVLQVLVKVLGQLESLCAKWLGKNPNAKGTPTLTALRTQVQAELAAVRGILQKRVQKKAAGAVVAKRKAIMSAVVKAKTEDARGKSLSWVGNDESELHGKAKHDKYIDEDKKYGWRSKSEKLRDKDFFVTEYHTTEKQREATRLKTAGSKGKIKEDGESVDKDNVGWVMDPTTGNVHAFNPTRADVRDRKFGITRESNFTEGVKKLQKDRERYQLRGHHHTTPLAGGDVAGAGQMNIERGRISKITDESGHYTPEAEYTHQAVREMERKNMPLVHREGDNSWSAKVGLTGYDEIKGAGKGWIKDHNDSVDDDSKKMYSGDLVLPYQAFLTSHGNEQQMRLKATLSDQIKKNVDKAPAHESTVPVSKPEQSSGGYATVDMLSKKDDEKPSSGGYATVDMLSKKDDEKPPSDGYVTPDLPVKKEDEKPPSDGYVTPDLVSKKDDEKPPSDGYVTPDLLAKKDDEKVPSDGYVTPDLLAKKDDEEDVPSDGYEIPDLLRKKLEGV